VCSSLRVVDDMDLPRTIRMLKDSNKQKLQKLMLTTLN